MRAWDKLRLRLRSLFSRRDVDRELETELGFHLDQLVEEKVNSGIAPDELPIGCTCNEPRICCPLYSPAKFNSRTVHSW